MRIIRNIIKRIIEPAVHEISIDDNIISPYEDFNSDYWTPQRLKLTLKEHYKESKERRRFKRKLRRELFFRNNIRIEK